MAGDGAQCTIENIEKDVFHSRINGVAQKFIIDLKEERERLGTSFPLCGLILDEAVERIYVTGRIPGKELYADVYKQKPIKLTQKVFVPVKQFPKFNFTGKLLGPKGNSLRRLQEETQCKITIKGRNSMRDRNKEDELRNSGDPKYSHLHKDLYYEISTISTPAECYARIAYALAEIRKFLIPDKNDEISHQQLRELIEIDPDYAKSAQGIYPTILRSVIEKKQKITKNFDPLNRKPSINGTENDIDDYMHGADTMKQTTTSSNSYVRGPHSSAISTMKRLKSTEPYDNVKRRVKYQ